MNEFERRMLDTIQTSAYFASMIREDKAVSAIDYYNYNFSVGTVAVPLAIGSTTSFTLQIQSDSYFVLNYMSAMAFDNAGVFSPQANILMQVTDTGSGKTFYSQPAQLSLVTGSQGFPFILSAPRVVNPNTNLKVDLTNATGVTLSGIFVNFMGARVYYNG
jgi:hypothetical protein